MKNNVVIFRTKKVNKALSDKTYEYCSVCWTKTEIAKETPVQLRHYYIEGVGQLCSACFLALYQ